MRYEFIAQPGEKQICFLAAGMNAHISKPVDMKTLEKTIRRIKIGGRGTETQAIEQ